MKKHLFLLFGLVIGLLFFLLVPRLSTKNSPSEKVNLSSARATVTNSSTFKSPSPLPPDVTPINADGIPADAKVLTPRISSALPVQVVAHSAKDFAWGAFVRTVVVQESLQLSPEAASDSVISGTFVSPQYLGHQSFDTISLSHAATIPAGSALKLDLRVLNGGNWSGWQELSEAELSQPISIDGWASGWQYRLTFSAPSAASSPLVQRVTITTRNSDAVVTAVKATAIE